ncbi:hypothetical protein [Gymnodinialimonas hymeniacidonis]|uniref:hypothetical protein n=1 Tax=Gymnodinialimonas hymeniacidonis TaxID=3126508 RepID=UPI0034C6B849
MMKRIASIAFAGLITFVALPAEAQNMLCGQREMVVNELTGRYGEEVRGMGLAHQNRIVEVFVSEETGTWTITVTSPNGMTCLMAAGQHFATMDPVAAGEDL